MRELKDSYWNQFTYYTSSGKKIRDGIKFENLVEKLLEIEYSAKWVRTSKTHDNSRDFHLTTTDYTQWAECKNYNDSISLETIAPTLVMAQIFDVNKIIFFSYSDINRFAKKKIYSFGEKTDKEIEIFAGNTLDQLILKNRDFLPKPFRPKIDQINSNADKPEIDCYFQFIQTPIIGSTAEDKLAIDISAVKKIYYNTIFEIDIVCINNSLNNNYSIEISLDDSNGIDNYYFTPVDNKFSDVSHLYNRKLLPAAGGIVMRYYFKSNIFQSELNLPVFKVKIQNSFTILKEFISPIQKVPNEWVGKTILIGEQYRNLLKKAESIVLNNDTISCLAIDGSSGVGKTRLLKESLEILLKHKYRIASFIGNKDDSTYTILKEIVYFIYEVPGDEILLGMQGNDNFMQMLDSNTPANHAYQLVQRFSKAHSTNEMIEIIDDAFEILYEKLSRERIAIVIDNVQYFDKALSYFIKRYLIYSKHQTRKNTSVLFLAFNLDYSTDDSNDLLNFIKELSKDIYQIQSYSIKGFKFINNGILFLRELLQIKDDSFDIELSIILEKTSLKPYYIYQGVYYLLEKEAIKYVETQKGYIISREIFHDSILQMPAALDKIIEQRWDFFLKKHQSLTESFFIIISVIYIFREINIELIDRLCLNSKSIQLLVEKMFLQKKENSVYCFDHDIIENFFVSTYPNLEKMALKQIELCNAEQKLIKGSFVYNYYRLFIGNTDYKTIQSIYENMYAINVPLKLSEKYYHQFLNLLFQKKKLFSSTDEWMKYIQGICDNAKNSLGLKKSEQFFQIVNTEIKNRDDIEIYLTPSFRNYMNKYADMLFYQKRNAEAIEYLFKIDDILNTIQVTHDNYSALKCMIFNRLYINYRELKSKIHKQNAQDSLDLSKKWIKKINSSLLKDEFTYLNLSDEGYDWYCYREDKNKLLAIWEKCENYPPKRLPQKAMNYFRKCIQLHLIRQRPIEALDTIVEAEEFMKINSVSRSETLVFNFSFSLYRIMALIIENPKKNYSEIIKQLNLSYGLSNLMAKKNWGDLLNLHAICCFYQKDSEGVYYHFKEAYEIYNVMNSSHFGKERKQFLLDNIYVAFSELKIFQQAKNFLSAEDWNEFVVKSTSKINYDARGIQQTIDKLFNLPCV